MKTYYGQMTREELNKKYFVPSSTEEMNAFIDMCESAGYLSGKTYNHIVQIGVNLAGDNKVWWNPIGSSHYFEKHMTQINWQPEQKDLKQQLKQAMSNLEKRKAKAQKANEKLEEAKKEVDRIAAEIEKHYEDIDGVCCSIRFSEPINAKAESDIPDGVDVDDPNTWKCGDIVKCIESQIHSIPEGSLYTFIKYKHDVLGFILDAGADDIIYASGNIEKFRFIRRP